MTDDTKTTAAPHSDALVLFGFTGDLANKKIFPALYAMAKRGELVPRVIGVAARPCAGNGREPGPPARARLRREGRRRDRRDGAAFDMAAAGDPLRQRRLQEARDLRRAEEGAGGRAAPGALPRGAAGAVRDGDPGPGRGRPGQGCAPDRREAVRPRPGASQKARRGGARSVFPEDAIFRIDQAYLGKEAIKARPPVLRCTNSVPGAAVVPRAHHQRADDDIRGLRRRRCSAFYETATAATLRDDRRGTTCSRSSRLLAMEPAALAAASPTCRPPRPRCSRRCARWRPPTWCAASTPATARKRTWRRIRTSRPSSRCACSWTRRAQQGVPFYLRAGKHCRPPPSRCRSSSSRRSRRCSPTPAALLQLPALPAAADLGHRARRAREAGRRQGVRRRAARAGRARGPGRRGSPAGRLLGDAMAGDGSLFTSLESVEAAWSAVDGISVDHPAVVSYAPGTWGPKEADALIAGDGGWQAPVPETLSGASTAAAPTKARMSKTLTHRASWKALASHHGKITPKKHLRELFAEDTDARRAADAGGGRPVPGLFEEPRHGPDAQAARRTRRGLRAAGERIAAMFRGDRINTTENPLRCCTSRCARRVGSR